MPLRAAAAEEFAAIGWQHRLRRKVAVMSVQLLIQLQQQPTDELTAMGMHI
jgi:hypothetical protein